MFSLPKTALFNIGKRLYSQPGNRASLVVLTYHRVLAAPDPILNQEINVETFVWHMQLLKRYFNVLPLAKAIDRLKNGSLPERAVCVCFDDGYADNYSNALPVLKKYDIPATFFIAVGFLDGGRMWNDSIIEAVRTAAGNIIDLRELGLRCYPIGSIVEKQQAVMSIINNLKYLGHSERLAHVNQIAKQVAAKLPTDLMMTTKQLKTCCDNGIEVGAHTVNHMILSHLPIHEAEQEITQSRDQLMASLNRDIKFFAYPNGKANLDYNREHIAIIRKSGFAAAFTTEWGGAQKNSDIYQLPRIAPWDASPFRFALRVLRTFKQNKFNCIKT